jgi:glycosyltransferase involved in cell wall biosynthesis
VSARGPRGEGAARPLRVLMLCPNFAPGRPLVGGAERQAEKLSLELVRRGCTVEMLAPRDDPSWPAESVENGLPVHRFPIADLSRALRRGAGVPNTLLRCAQTVRAVRWHLRRFDVLHCHMATALTAFAAIAARGTGRPVVCKVGSGGETFDLRTTRATTLGGGLLTRSMVRNVSRWAALSGEIEADLLAWGVSPERIERIPNGVKPLHLAPLDPAGAARRFLFLARFDENRDVASLVSAFEKVAERFPDAELVLAGSGPLEGAARERAERSPARYRIRLVGHGNPARWLEWAQVVVQPSLREGMSNTLLEAMAAGRACVATDIAPNRELLDGGRLGALSRPGDAESMADAMLRLASAPGEAARLGSLARRRVEEGYDVAHVAERYLALYHSLVSKASGVEVASLAEHGAITSNDREGRAG